MARKLGGCGSGFGTPSFQRDAVAGDGVYNGSEWFRGGNAQSPPLRRCVLRVTDSCSSFRGREFPKMGVHHSFRALADKIFAVALDHEGDAAAFGDGFAFGEVGELVLPAFFLCDAEFLLSGGSR